MFSLLDSFILFIVPGKVVIPISLLLRVGSMLSKSSVVVMGLLKILMPTFDSVRDTLIHVITGFIITLVFILGFLQIVSFCIVMVRTIVVITMVQILTQVVPFVDLMKTSCIIPSIAMWLELTKF